MPRKSASLTFADQQYSATLAGSLWTRPIKHQLAAPPKTLGRIGLAAFDEQACIRLQPLVRDTIFCVGAVSPCAYVLQNEFEPVPHCYVLTIPLDASGTWRESRATGGTLGQLDHEKIYCSLRWRPKLPNNSLRPGQHYLLHSWSLRSKAMLS